MHLLMILFVLNVMFFLCRQDEDYEFSYDDEPSPSPQGYGGTPNPQTPGYPEVPSPQVNPQYNPQTPGTPAMWEFFWISISSWSFLAWLTHGLTFGLYNCSAGTTQISTLHMQHHPHRALTSLALVRRVITRWPQVQWVTKTPTHQLATTQHPHPWHTRYFFFFFLSNAFRSLLCMYAYANELSINDG